VLLLFLTSSVEAGLQVYPDSVKLSGAEARQRLLVLETDDESGEVGAPVVPKLFFSTAPNIVELGEDGRLIPRGNGSAHIIAQHEGSTVTIPVEVTDFAKSQEWSFSNHVVPVLSKMECNSGGCHGAIAGKGGFRLSLFGYDPPFDFRTITRENRGRRVELADPGRSLLLLKPTTLLRHKGGHRLEQDSEEYRILAEWVAHGAASPSPDDARLERLDVMPPLATLEVGDKLPLLVRAHYDNGDVEDVTNLVRFTSTDETVATVDEHGLVEIIDHGQGAVTAWFSSQIEIARVVVPYALQVPAEEYAEASQKNFIDELVLQQLERLRLAPSPAAEDGAFLRRAMIDTIGKLPTPQETRAWLADKSHDKRNRLADELLARPEFIDYWSYKLSDILLVSGAKLRPEAVKAYYLWIRGELEANTPWDEFTRRLITSKGDSITNGATNFYAVHQDPENMAENVSQAFLSLSIGCAKCHNHPLEKWTNDQYYAFANLFSRVRAKGWGGDARNGDGIRTVFVEPRGDLVQPRTGKPQAPAPLDAAPISPDDPGDRRVVLAEWLTSPDNEAFSRSITNRVWANFLGVGLVESVDDLRKSNPASNEPLLAALSAHLVQNGFDLKALMRAILVSDTYARTSVPLATNEADRRHYSRAFPRRLMAEVLEDAITDVTGVSSKYVEIALNDGSSQKTDFYPEGTSALQLYDSAVSSYFLKTFGRNSRDITCECERSNQPSMVQVLHLSNGSTLNDKLRAEKGRVTDLMKQFPLPAKAGDLVEEAYLLCLSRLPQASERETFTKILAEAPEAERRAVVEDLFWSLLTSREFLFQH